MRTGICKRAVATAALLAVVVAVPATARAAAPDPFYGVANQDALGAQDYPLMEQAGVGTVRLFVHWPSIQAHKGECQSVAQVGVCDWRRYDSVIGGLAAAGIETFPYLLNVPRFVARDPEAPPLRSKSDRRAWAGFLRALIERYGRYGAFWETTYQGRQAGRSARPIQRWEIWNEPSDAPYWHPRPDPRQYAQLVRLSGKAIHSADPTARVVLAGLYGFPNEKRGGIEATDFYGSLLERKRLGRFFDEVAIHPYAPSLGLAVRQIRRLRRLMRRTGYGRRDLWVTEIGWASDGIHHKLGKTPSRQARLLTQTFETFARNRGKWNLRGVIWYAWQDFPNMELCGFCAGSGLVEFDRETKPAYGAFRSVAG